MTLRKPARVQDILNAVFDSSHNRLRANSARAATRFVASADADDLVKESADYVCDGTDDQVEIQAAIDALPSSGGKVVLSEGTFTLSSNVSANGVTNGTLQGQGMESTTLVLDIDFPTNQHAVALEGTEASPLGSWVVRDLKIDGDNMDANAMDPSAHIASIQSMWVSRVAMERVWIANSAANAVNVSSGATAVLAINNLLTNIGQGEHIGHGIRVMRDQGSDPLDDPIENVVISGNIVRGVGFNAFPIYGNTRFVTVTGNVIEGNEWSHSPIALSPGERTTVSGNNIRGITREGEAGVEFQASGSASHAGGPVTSRDMVVTGNFIEDSYQGILSDLRGGVAEGQNNILSITGNVIRNTEHDGIFIEDTHLLTITGNVLHDNRIGINVRDSDRMNISANNVHMSTLRGINVRESGEVLVGGNQIFGPNVLGINVFDVDDVAIIGNLVIERDSASYIETLIQLTILEATTSNALVAGNKTVTNNNDVDQALRIGAGVNNALVENNDFRGTYGVATIVDDGTDTIIRHNTGYATEAHGTETQSGDGTTTAFTIPHDLVATPTHVSVTPLRADANAARLVTVDDTNITVTYDSAPGSGTNNLEWAWEAKV